MKEEQSHFIKNIEIKNFKCFENFSAEGFGRVNLIGGKNNVGKTAFMEAIFIASFNNKLKYSMDDIIPFLAIESYRNTIDIYKEIPSSSFIKIFDKYDNIQIKHSNSYISLKQEKKGFDETFFINEKRTYATREHQGSVSVSQKFNNFVPSYMIGNNLIISIFDKIKEERKREQLNKILNEFDKNILEFDIINDKPHVFLKSQEKFQDVAELGHGLKRYIAIISSILINKNGLLFLDELENGIHYTNLDELWKVILKTSEEANVQVFATTHSKECIESYARMAKKLDEKNEDITYTYLTRLKDNSLYASIYTKDILETAIQQEHEVR